MEIIIIYVVIIAAVGVFKTIQKSKVKTVSVPPPQKKESGMSPMESFFEYLSEELKGEKLEKQPFGNEKEAVKTVLGEDPYKNSVEYRSREKKARRAKVSSAVAKIEKEEPDSLLHDIDWKKAIIYSEILKPRF